MPGPPAPAQLLAWRDRALAEGVARPFNAARASCLPELARRLRELGADDEVLPVAFWLRDGNVRRLAASWAARPRADRSVARGIVVQYLPSSVPLLGLFTWSLAFLAGNATAVRLSTRSGPLAVAAFARLEEVLRDAGLGATTTVVASRRDDAATRALSAIADVRMIWGGDQSVRAVRALDSGPDCLDVAFAGRFSLAGVAAGRYLGLDGPGRLALARAFASDVCWLDQLACSSPMLLAWIGPADAVAAARPAFHDALRTALAERPPRGPRRTIDVLAAACRAAAEAPVRSVERLGTGLAVAVLPEGAGPWPRDRSASGLLLDARVEDVEALAGLVQPADQTLAAFGIDGPDVDRILGHPRGRWLRRIVPIGHAHEFDEFWDGHDLLGALTRVVAVSAPTRSTAARGW